MVLCAEARAGRASVCGKQQRSGGQRALSCEIMELCSMDTGGAQAGATSTHSAAQKELSRHPFPWTQE